MTPEATTPETATPEATTPDLDADLAAPRRRRRTWPQRLVLGFNVVLVLGCLVAAVAVFIGQKNVEDVKRAPFDPNEDVAEDLTELVVQSLIGGTSVTSVATPASTVAPTTTIEGFIEVTPGSVRAENYLMTGSDSRDCIDPASPYAGAFLGAGADGGSRPDTIMILRVEPDTERAAILSFPRDLWVPVAGSTRKSKINAAFDKTDPTTLIATIESYFFIPIDHYINVDFCVFKDLVDAVGGVSVPFLTPVRDKNTGLLVDNPGCYTFGGDHALAYVRSRHIQYQDSKGLWYSEGTADIGRIRRQQDFLRRVMQEVRSQGLLDLAFVKKLIDSFQARVEVDLDLTADDLLRLANAMQSFDPATTRSFIIEGKFAYKGNLAVVEPILDSDRMLAVLSIFRGQASVSEAPEEQTDPITTEPPTTPPATAVPPATTVPISGTSAPAPPTTINPFPTTTLEEIDVPDNIDLAYGGGNAVVPDKFAVCD